MGVWIETSSSQTKDTPDFVTPFVGVWIETGRARPYPVRAAWSHPSWVCGLKQRRASNQRSEPRVTPFVGVWIETHVDGYATFALYVTPFVGVWIETRMPCGSPSVLQVTPFVGVWIET